MKPYALLSVTDKTGVVAMAQSLQQLGYAILSTAGTSKVLTAGGVDVEDISEYTQFSEVLEGRVKSLHPLIYAGILHHRQHEDHEQDLRRLKARPIDLVVLNFYDFKQALSHWRQQQPPQPGPEEGPEEHFEDKIFEIAAHIDIGGPCMLRAAAKNWAHVLPVCDPQDYEPILQKLQNHSISLSYRRSLAAKAFFYCQSYDEAIYQALQQPQTPQGPSAHISDATFNTAHSSTAAHNVHATITKVPLTAPAIPLRYGENHHQQASFVPHQDPHGLGHMEKLQGKDLSYNNYLDLDSVSQMLLYSRPLASCIVVKHTNACGASWSQGDHNAEELWRRALLCDARSAFGGVVGFSVTVDGACAEAMRSHFLEVIIAPHFHPQALAVLAQKPQLRLITAPWLARDNPSLQTSATASLSAPTIQYRSILGGTLYQSKAVTLNENTPVSEIWEQHPWMQRQGMTLVSEYDASPQDMTNLFCAHTIAAFQKSNALAFCKDLTLITQGCGHTSRIDACSFAIKRLPQPRENLRGAVMASDGFFPFRDVIDEVAKVGVRAVVSPQGSIRDADSIGAANDHRMALLFSQQRHFRH